MLAFPCNRCQLKYCEVNYEIALVLVLYITRCRWKRIHKKMFCTRKYCHFVYLSCKGMGLMLLFQNKITEFLFKLNSFSKIEECVY